jgi:hypothetical protein
MANSGFGIHSKGAELLGRDNLPEDDKQPVNPSLSPTGHASAQPSRSEPAHTGYSSGKKNPNNTPEKRV